MADGGSEARRDAAPPTGAPPISASAATASATGPDAGTGRKIARRPRRRLRRWVLLVLGPLVVASVAGYFYVTGGRYVSTDDAYLKGDKVMVAAEVPGSIARVEVRENQHVDRGDVLFRLDDRRYRIALAAAEADLAGVRDQVAAQKATYREKQMELARARTDAAFARSEFDRYAKLVSTSAVSRSSYDTARHALDVAEQTIRVIEQQIAQAKAALAGDPDIEVERHPSYLAAEAARDRAAFDLDKTVVRAPIAGVASNVPQRGEQVTGSDAFVNPVMSVVADSGLWIEANFKETDLTHVRPGQPVTVTVDAFPGDDWRGTVQSIGPATGAEFAVIPQQNATGNWVKVVQRVPVRIAVDINPGGPPLRVGMSTVVDIDTGQNRALPGFLSTALAWLGVGPEPARAAASP
jgi:membrane fusion protein (multidrug efflux system)